jgi:hypothetical protein
MTSDLARAVKGSSGFLNGFDPCKDPGHSVFPCKWKQGSVRSALRAQARRIGLAEPNRMGIGNENDQALKGHSVDALACTGDEGRDTLR